MWNHEDVEAAARIAERIANEFYCGRLSGWAKMPEVIAADCLRSSGASDREVRLFLTFIGAVDLMCDARKLWRNGVALLDAHPEAFDPFRVSIMPTEVLFSVLSDKNCKVSGRFPSKNVKAWKNIAHMLAHDDGPVRRVIDEGVGDAKQLRYELQSTTDSGYCFFQLKGPKIGPMWVRLMAAPGNAKIEKMNTIPVAVDTRVRRATESLGVTRTQGLSDANARRQIQAAWFKAVEQANFSGPPGIEGTCAALDPALWSYKEDA